MLTLEKALSLDALKNAIVLSGKKGLKNEISCINVMEVPDIYDWVTEGEFILTTGYPFKDSPTELADVIHKLSHKRLSGIAVKTKRYIDELPAEVLQTADELGFPLIQLPADARFASIISGLMPQVISKEEKEDRLRIDFLNEVALGKISSPSTLLDQAKRFEINMQAPYIAYVVTNDSVNSKAIKSKYFEQLVTNAFISLGELCVCWTYQDKVNVFIPIQPKIDDVKTRSVAIGRLLYNHLVDTVKDIQVAVGIGTYHKGNINLSKSYTEAIQAMRIGYMSSMAGVYHYDDIGIYQILMPFAGTESASRYIDSFLGKLIEYDKNKKTQLVSTLEQFIKCDSLEEAANNLFVHSKTLALRKAKIEKILGVSLKSEEVKLTLLAAIMLYRVSE